MNQQVSPAPRPAPSSRTLALLVGGILFAGGAAGVMLNRGPALTAAAESVSADDSIRESREMSVDGAGLTPAAAQGSGLAAGADGTSGDGARGGDVRRLPDLRLIEIAPPENPFLPPSGGYGDAPAAASGAGLEGVPQLPPVFGSVPPAPDALPQPTVGRKPVAARPVEPVPAGPQVKPDDLQLTGIIQGDPAITVVRVGGQSFFLKIGDVVADTWRLVGIGERSATFQHGEQRVEIPIKGGSSQ